VLPPILLCFPFEKLLSLPHLFQLLVVRCVKKITGSFFLTFVFATRREMLHFVRAGILPHLVHVVYKQAKYPLLTRERFFTPLVATPSGVDYLGTAKCTHFFLSHGPLSVHFLQTLLHSFVSITHTHTHAMLARTQERTRAHTQLPHAENSD